MERLRRVGQRLASVLAAILLTYVLALLARGAVRLPGLEAPRTLADLWPAVGGLLTLILVRGALGCRPFSWTTFLADSPPRLFCLVLLVYIANGATLSTPDTVPARVLPWALLHGEGFSLDAWPALHGGNPAAPPYFLRFVNGHWVSDYPVGAVLLALPFYVVSAAGGADPSGRLLLDLEKLSAAVLTAGAAALLLAALRRYADRGAALGAALLFALATSNLSVSSQALWQHGPGQLALVGGLYALARARTEPAWAAAAGFPLALAVVVRPTNLLLALPIGLFAWLSHRQARWALCLGAAPPVLFQLWYNAAYFAEPLRTQFPVLGVWQAPFWEGLAGILASPGRGLFVYSPVLLLAFVGLALAWRPGGEPLLRWLGGGAVAAILLYANYRDWWGGWSYGPRLLADLSPALAFLLLPALERCWPVRSARVMLIALAVWSVAAHGVGLTQRAPYWHAAVDGGRMVEHLWRWGDNQLVNPARDLVAERRITLQGLPTSATDPQGLAAAYVADLAPGVRAAGGDRLRVTVRARNQGQAIWLARGVRGRGAVGLGWQWRALPDGAAGPAGVLGLRYDVFPGAEYDFLLSLPVPARPGVYRLEFGLGCDRTGFVELGSPALAVRVEVAAAASPRSAGERAQGIAARPDRETAAHLAPESREPRGGRDAAVSGQS